MNKFKRVGSISDIPPGSGNSFRFGDKRIAIFNIKGKFHAIDDACPHRGAPLGDGPLRDNVVTCTWHGWEFDVVKGCHIIEEDMKLNRYKTKVKGKTLYVSLEPIEGLKNDA